MDYRCVYDVKNVICVKTGLDWRKLGFKMERIRKKCFSRSTAFIVDFTWEVNCTQLCNNYRPISTVQIQKDIVRSRGSNGVYSWVYNKSMFFNDFFQ